MESPWECGIETPVSISHGVSYLVCMFVKSTGKRPIVRARRRWEDSIRMNLEEMGNSSRKRAIFSQDRDYWRALVNAALKPRVL